MDLSGNKLFLYFARVDSKSTVEKWPTQSKYQYKIDEMNLK